MPRLIPSLALVALLGVPASLPAQQSAGKKYALLADFYRTPGETIHGTVQMPGTDTSSTTVPSAVESGSGFKINCGL